MAGGHLLGWLGAGSLLCYRLVTRVLLFAVFVFASTVLALRYWILPDIERYRESIARIVSERAGQKITIDRIESEWDGLRPRFVLSGVTVHDAAGRPEMRFARMEQTLSWLSAALLDLRFHSLAIHEPRLSIRRDARGIVSVAGLELDRESAGGGGFADWLLRQRDISVRNATLVWTDEQRGAPPLELKHVDLQIYSRGGRHRFGLRAVPPEALAAPLDVRGDVRGESFRTLSEWRGRLFLQLDHADLAAWRTWVTLPIEIARGQGALRAWLAFDGSRIAEVTADVRLSGVRARLAADLPELALEALDGRIGWKHAPGTTEVTTSGLRLVASDGLVLPPADFFLRYTRAAGRRPAQGEMRVDALELEPLVALADRLPLDAGTRRRLAEFSPKGGLYDLSVAWTGEWGALETYRVRGRFREVALRRAGRAPGFAGLTGSVDANERNGTLSVNSRAATVEMPLVFTAPLAFDSFTAQVAWTRGQESTELRLNGVSFSNEHLAGTVFGTYRTTGSVRGHIDLTGRLHRADARYVSRYIPLVVGPRAREWLDQAFLAGASDDVSLRLKGDLDRFPFADGQSGVFQVAARVAGGELRYAAGWPTIRDIAGDLLFRGSRMIVHARQGATAGARLGRVHVEIPDLESDEPVLHVNGEATGPTQRFLDFIERTPVAEMTGGFTEGWRAQGNGRLTLRVVIPLEALAATRVAGQYRFTANSVTLSPGLPALEQASGQLEFTDRTVTLENARAILLGGPVTVSASTARDATVRVALRGRVNADGARKAGAPDWVRHLRGSTDWTAAVQARRRDADFTFESTLQGLAVDLPAPFAKAASQSMPLRIERKRLAAGEERLSARLGEVASLNLVRRLEPGGPVITRGAVRFGGPAAPPERPGVWVSGDIGRLDADRWLALDFPGGAGGGTRVEWGGVTLNIAELDFLGRRYAGLGVNASASEGRWQIRLSGKELDGEVSWLPEGRGRVVARMKRLAIPSAARAGEGRQAAGLVKAADWPAIDVVAEEFINKDRVLGRLEFRAAPQGTDWQIEKARIENPESVFELDGVRSDGAVPGTRISLRLDVSDAGRLLTRLGYPEGVRRGTARLQGAVSWRGALHEIDYATLSGNLVLEAAKGQFVKLEPGIGKLLGILSLQALPRRITLDFRDVFSEGFSFDEIIGTVSIDRGIARSEQFRIEGPSARIAMSGAVDLARETQKLRVRVTPHVSDGVSLAGALVGGPVAGVAAFLAQKVLKDPLGQIVSYEYDIAGTWAEPVVTKVVQPAPAAEPPPP